ncbi:hypothetical protein Tcan_05043 [Toxocara canis]|uniref:Uncharacterized protein n=1 Tax=Toxocara canis TaxID=6265 RepID=A0A0B2V3I4_TOXCA|nr:hypothetical protein Tcan_05043 [Toxocara canis]
MFSVDIKNLAYDFVNRVGIFVGFILSGVTVQSNAFQCTFDETNPRVFGTHYQLKENINTTRLMIPTVTINAVLVLSYSVTYAIFFPSLGQNASITKELLNSINQYAPVAEFLVSIHCIDGRVMQIEQLSAVRSSLAQGGHAYKLSVYPCTLSELAISKKIILLMPVVTSAFIFCIPLLSAHIRRSLFRLTGLRHCFQDSSNRIDSVEQAATRIYFEMLEKQWEESFKRERRRLPARSQNYFAGAT